MGQKTSPIGFRLVINKKWKSIWYANKQEFGNLIIEDKVIRDFLIGKYGKAVADEISILYGGSCNAKNAKELFANPDVDGGLIGGAALKSDDFIAIVQSF